VVLHEDGAATDFFAVVDGQRAHRWFTDEPVADDDLTRMLAAAIRAPSAENSQPWQFVVVRATEGRAALAEIARRLWHGGGRDHAAANVDADMLADIDASIDAGFGGAPVLVVVAADSLRTHPRTFGSSLFPAVQNLLLAAGALGYGSTLTTLASYAPDDVRAAVGLPEHLVPIAVVPIGRPAKPLGRSRREPLDTKVHQDRYATGDRT
jgi:nitroreductase